MDNSKVGREVEVVGEVEVEVEGEGEGEGRYELARAGEFNHSLT